MKQVVSVVLALLLIGSVMMMTGCAQEVPKAGTTIVLTIGEDTMTVNGEEKPIDENGTVPVIQNNRTLLPIRAVIEAIGGTVEWNNQTREVTLRYGKDQIKLTIDQTVAYFNGEEKKLDTAPCIIHNRTMLPIRFIAESFGFAVQWNESTKQVTIQNQTPVDEKEAKRLQITIGETVLTVQMEENTATDRLMEILSKGDITVPMEDYGDFEKVGALPENLPQNDKETTANAGDIVLYQGNRLVILYGSNTWSYTRLGKIVNMPTEELKKVLGKGSATAILSLGDKEKTAEQKSLVVYFSCTHNTKNLAEKIAAATGSDLFEIVPAEPYTAADINYNSDCRANREQNDDTARPEIANPIHNLDDYDTVYLGYPIWWGTMPKIINTFLETYDLSDKTVMPFCTSGSSGIAVSENAIRAYLPQVKTGFRGPASTTEAQIKSWIEKNQ